MRGGDLVCSDSPWAMGNGRPFGPPAMGGSNRCGQSPHRAGCTDVLVVDCGGSCLPSVKSPTWPPVSAGAGTATVPVVVMCPLLMPIARQTRLRSLAPTLSPGSSYCIREFLWPPPEVVGGLPGVRGQKLVPRSLSSLCSRWLSLRSRCGGLHSARPTRTSVGYSPPEDATIPHLLLPSGAETDDAGLLLSGISIDCEVELTDWPTFRDR